MPSLEQQIKDQADNMQRAVEALKANITEREAELAKKTDIDPLIKAQTDKINEHIEKIEDGKKALEKGMTEQSARIEALELAANRPGASGSIVLSPEKKAHADAFGTYMRKGSGEAQLAELETKTVSVGTNSDGGYALPEQIDRQVYNEITEETPMLGIVSRMSISTPDYKKLVNRHGATSGWVGETAARPATSSPTLEQVVPTMGEIYSNPATTQQALDDLFINVGQWLTSEVALEFAQEINLAVTTGNGTNKPTGFLDGTPVVTADDTRAFGTLQFFATGAATDFAASDPWTVIYDLVYGIKAGYRRNARFVTSRAILKDIRIMKDGDGNLIWRPGLAAGQPSELAGFPITENEDMPAKAANAFSLAFGDFRRGYLFVDRIGTRTLRDPFTNKPNVHFYTTKRVGGKVVDSNAIKLMKFSA